MFHSVSIARQQYFIASLYSAFRWLFNLKNDYIYTLNEARNNLIMVDRKPDEVVTLDFTYEDLERKIYTWAMREKGPLELNEKETEMLYRCVYAAWFYLQKQSQYNIGECRTRINWLYGELLRNLPDWASTKQYTHPG